MSDWYRETVQKVLQNFDTQKNGLAESEIRKRRIKYGSNKLKEKKAKSALAIFLDQFKELMVIILIAAVLISILLHDGRSSKNASYYLISSFRKKAQYLDQYKKLLAHPASFRFWLICSFSSPLRSLRNLCWWPWLVKLAKCRCAFHGLLSRLSSGGS